MCFLHKAAKASGFFRYETHTRVCPYAFLSHTEQRCMLLDFPLDIKVDFLTLKHLATNVVCSNRNEPLFLYERGKEF